MKRVNPIISLIVVMLLTSLTAAAQSPLAKLKKWSDGPLIWADFRGKSEVDGVPSYLKATLSIASEEYQPGSKSASYRLSAEAVANCELSFADIDKVDDQRLRYHQLQFDVLEYYRRRLQSELNAGVSGLEAENRLRHYQMLFADRIDQIAKTTNNGSADNRLQEEEYLVRKQLEELGLPPMPIIKASNFGYGIYAGVGGVFPTSSISDDFSGCATFILGLTGGYRRLKLKADISFGQPNFNNDNIFDVPSADYPGRPGQGNTNSYATFLGISTSIGYTVLDTKRFSITPNVGGYWSSYGWNVANYYYETEPNEAGEPVLVQKVSSTEKRSISDFGWMASIDFDIKFHKHVGDTPFFLTGQREEFTSAIRISPFVARASFAKPVPAIEGYYVGVNVTYTGIARALRLE